MFAAGTNYWAWKLDDNPYRSFGADARVQRMTANLLATMISNVAGTPPPTPTPTPSVTPPQGMRYTWDAPGDAQGWQRGAGAVVGLGQSTAQAQSGAGSLEVSLALGGPGGSQGGVVVYPSPPRTGRSTATPCGPRSTYRPARRAACRRS